MTPDTRIRCVVDGDWNDIVALEAGAYRDSGLSEEPAALRSRARASPATCFVLDVAHRTVGYVLSLPYPLFRYPDLTRPEGSTFGSRNLHLHDFVIADGFRRGGLGSHLLRHLTTSAEALGHERISLVAVAGSDTFWSARGYHAHSDVALPSSYGANAVYMSRTI